MIRVGITGQAGFIGGHLAQYITARDDAKLIQFEDGFFEDELLLRQFVKSCDVIIHLAAASRMPSEKELYNLNVGLVNKVIAAMELENVKPLVMFSSSTHEVRDTAYGRAKLEGRMLFEAWAKRNNASFVGFVFPNIYGPGAKVHYASFIANFAWELQHGIEPQIIVDALLKLKYVGNLCECIGGYLGYEGVARIEIDYDFEIKVSDVLGVFKLFLDLPEDDVLNALARNSNLLNLYKTFVSYRI